MKWRMSPLLRVVMTGQTNEISGLLWRAAERINSRRAWWYFSKKRKQGWNAWGMMGNGSWRVSLQGVVVILPPASVTDSLIASLNQDIYEHHYKSDFTSGILQLSLQTGIIHIRCLWTGNQTNIVSGEKIISHTILLYYYTILLSSEILDFHPIILFLTTSKPIYRVVSDTKNSSGPFRGFVKKN